MEFDQDKPWYHGSPLKLEVLREGSTMTQWQELARVFSHKPAVVCISDDRRIRHNGTLPGYLYEIVEPVGSEDVIPHPRTTMEPGDEWLTARDLRLRLIGETVPLPEELLSDADIAALRERLNTESQDRRMER
jgi:hypothetical protein